MDFKYIEQLIDRYFEGETTLEEEHILNEFFAQTGVPAHLSKWKPLFQAQRTLAEAHLDDDFDSRILSLIGEQHVQARPIRLSMRLRPLFKAAAFVAFAIVIGTAVEHAADTATVLPESVASADQDELKSDETTAIDIKSAEATETLADTAVAIPVLAPLAQ